MAGNGWNTVWRTSKYSVTTIHYCTCSRKLFHPSAFPVETANTEDPHSSLFHWLKVHPGMLVLHALEQGEITTSNAMCE